MMWPVVSDYDVKTSWEIVQPVLTLQANESQRRNQPGWILADIF